MDYDDYIDYINDMVLLYFYGYHLGSTADAMTILE